MQGIHPESGAFLDPWGRPYRIWLGSGESTEMAVPHKDCDPIRMIVAAWSVGKDGLQGTPGNENILQDSDDVVSWQ